MTTDVSTLQKSGITTWSRDNFSFVDTFSPRSKSVNFLSARRGLILGIYILKIMNPFVEIIMKGMFGDTRILGRNQRICLYYKQFFCNICRSDFELQAKF